MKIVEEPNTFGYVTMKNNSRHCLLCRYSLSDLFSLLICSLNNPLLAQGSRLQPKVNPYPVSGKLNSLTCC